jgi:beta-lactamase class A
MTREQLVLDAIAREMETIPGHLGFYYKNLVTGLEFGINETDAFLAASVIKFPLLLHVLTRAAGGELSLSDKLVVENQEKMPSCGGLNQFTGLVEADILTLCRLMIVLSDNTATNKLFRFCGIENCNTAFREMGLAQVGICTSPDNLRSQSVIRKCGFVYEGTIRHSYETYTGECRDSMCFSILREEWEALEESGIV